MSKRFIYPQHYGERKKPKLDVTISDHNFPLSQNPTVNNVAESNSADAWGDEDDDEILLLASQACEEVYNNDISALPDYSICMQPSSTSTQMPDYPRPSTSKSNFVFKKPVAAPSSISIVSQNQHQRISSPLPGIAQKVIPKLKQDVNISNDMIFSDKIFKGQDSDNLYRQMLLLQEENTKLKSDNGRLLEKCVTKEGEASILRTQLKSAQVAVDNARLEKIRAQEKVQMEWTEKLTAANQQMQDLRTQLDFKNLEIISVKEKCKMLESTKVKLTQVPIVNNDYSTRNKSSSYAESFNQTRRQIMTSHSVQTDNNSPFIKLNKAYRMAKTQLTDIIPLVLQPTTEEMSILDYNDKLLKPTEFSQSKCRVYSTFHRMPSTPNTEERCKSKLAISCLHDDLTFVASVMDKGVIDGVLGRFMNLVSNVTMALNEVLEQLKMTSRRMTTAFQKDMDERHIECTNTYVTFSDLDLLSNRSLYKEEQGILSRRMTAVLAQILHNTKDPILVRTLLKDIGGREQNNGCIVNLVCRICDAIENTYTGILYTGLLLSITSLLGKFWDATDKSTLHTKLLEITRTIVISRPMPVVSCKLLILLKNLATLETGENIFCAGNTVGNLRVDYDQGVMLFKKDTCYLQVFLKQIEIALKCIERDNMTTDAVEVCRDLIGFYSILYKDVTVANNRCDCQNVLNQVVIYSLQICALMLKNSQLDDNLSKQSECLCRSGILILYQQLLKGPDFWGQLGFHEGHYNVFLEICDALRERIVCNETQGNMLSELLTSLQSSTEDIEVSVSEENKQVWMDSFTRFSLTD